MPAQASGIHLGPGPVRLLSTCSAPARQRCLAFINRSPRLGIESQISGMRFAIGVFVHLPGHVGKVRWLVDESSSSARLAQTSRLGGPKHEVHQGLVADALLCPAKCYQRTSRVPGRLMELGALSPCFRSKV